MFTGEETLLKPGITSGTHTSPPDNISFYFTTEKAWDAMYDDCLRASRSINLEEYIFSNDGAGARFLRLFLQ